MISKESLVGQGDLDWVNDSLRYPHLGFPHACPESVNQFKLNRNPNKMI